MGLLSTIGAASARAYGFTRSAIAAAVDAYFNRVTLLLPGNGTNGAQNNTFLDSSSNNFTITRNGNTTQGTFTPFSQTGWSIYSAGTGSLQAGSNAALAPGSGNFTVECWVYPIGNSSYMGIYQNYTDGLSRSTALRISINTTDNTSLIVQTQASAIITAPTGSMTANAWNHIALVRNGSGTNNLVLYVNGVSKGTATNTTNFSDGFAQVGNTVYNAANYYWNGYISNFRIVPGTAVYTGAFTPPTNPLTAISGTALLTCQSNRFVDNSSNAFTLTVSGTPSVQAFEPFAPGSAYTTTAIGGSGYFDGTGDYLTATNAALIATGDFTVEAWVYTTQTGAFQGIIVSSDSADTAGFRIAVTNGNNAEFWLNGTSNATTALISNQWNHIAMARSGTGTNNVSCYLNGTRVAQFTNILTTTNSTVALGRYRYNADANYLKGYISGARYIVGSAIYSGTTITVPTAPPTAVTNTQLLLNYTNAGIYDAASKNDLETVGNAQISTTQSKFGGSSIAFDGTDDRLTFPASQNFNFGTGPFTIEGWVYFSSFPANKDCGILQLSDVAGGLEANATNIAIRAINTAGSGWGIYAKNAINNAGGTLPVANQWYHFAMVRNGTNTNLYIDGTSVIALTADTTDYSTYINLVVGGYYSTSFLMTGYIDDLRITKGYARYTANFTPPTSAFPLQ